MSARCSFNPQDTFQPPPHQVMCSEQHIHSTWMFAEQIKQMDSGCRLCTITVNGDPPPFKHRRHHAAPALWLQKARRGVECDSAASDATVHTRVKRSETRRDPSLSARGDVDDPGSARRGFSFWLLCEGDGLLIAWSLSVV